MSNYRIEILKIAEIEFSDAFDWYEEKQKGLGKRFLKEISIYLNSISDNPYKFAAKYNNEFHFAPLRIFPYVIVYWVDRERNIVFVASFFHTSRNPKKFSETDK